jgi:hypothetical protein
MLASTLKKFAHALPFEPFVIQMNDGRKFQVRHPDFVTVSPKGLSVYVFGSDDGATHLSSLLIASIKALPPRRRRSAPANPRRQGRG